MSRKRHFFALVSLPHQCAKKVSGFIIVKWILDETEFCPGINPAKSRHKILQPKDSEE